MAGTLVISLDFELFWGLFDEETPASYGDRVRGVHRALPALLDRFRAHELPATWATLGVLLCRNKAELSEMWPTVRPAYADPRFDAYAHLAAVGRDDEHDPLHFAPRLVDRILSTPGQELATHTFAHYYVGEAGADEASFAADLDAALEAGRRRGVVMESIVFPRNQMNDWALAACARAGLRAYRGAPGGWWREPSPRARQAGLLARALRLADAYLPLAPTAAPPPARDAASGLVNVVGSRFWRPYHPRLAALDGLRLARVAGELGAVARRGGTYHLWWHPHNFGRHLAENLALLDRLLAHVDRLRAREGLAVATMAEAARAAS